MAECVESDNNSYDMGRIAILDAMRKKTAELYGLPASNWCKEMFDYIDQEYKKLSPDGEK